SSIFSTIRLPPTSTLFPYTTLFRSRRHRPRRLGSGGLLRSRGRRRRAAEGGEQLDPGRDSPPAEGARRRGHFGRARERRASGRRSEEHTSELQSRENLVCRLLLEKK